MMWDRGGDETKKEADAEFRFAPEVQGVGMRGG